MVKDCVDVVAELQSGIHHVRTLERFMRKSIATCRSQHVGTMPQGPVEVSLRLTGDAAIRRLNKKWRDIDRPTDVLSFQLDMPGPTHHHLGDIVVSMVTAKKQAVNHQRTVEDELRTLVVHGLLHLLGFDHQDDASERTMENAAATLGYPSLPQLESNQS